MWAFDVIKNLPNTISNAATEYQNYTDALWQKGADWNAAMANTAVQRRVQDLQAAGFSPVSLLKVGVADSPTMATESNDIGAGIASAVDTYKGLASGTATVIDAGVKVFNAIKNLANMVGSMIAGS